MNKRYKLVRATFILIFLPIILHSQQFKGFEIYGHIEGLENGEKILLGESFTKGWKAAATRVDSCIVTNGGDFRLKGIAPSGGPYFYFIEFNSDRTHKHRVWNPKLGGNIGGAECDLLVDNGQMIKIQGSDINKIPGGDIADWVNIEGSPTNDAFRSLKTLGKITEVTIKLLNRKITQVKDSIGYDRSLVGSYIEAKELMYRSLGWKLLEPYAFSKSAIPWLICEIEDELCDHASFEVSVYNNLDSSAKSSYFGRKLKGLAALAIGQPMPHFTLPAPDGKLVSLKDIVSKSSITLVHFWASNSIEREKYQKELLFHFNKYHDKGLNIIGVSADSLEKEWKIRVQVEQYPWINVSDLKGNLKGGIVNDVYGEGGHSIPNTTNVLLDSEGKIITWDANGGVLQYYLEKYLGKADLSKETKKSLTK